MKRLLARGALCALIGIVATGCSSGAGAGRHTTQPPRGKVVAQEWTGRGPCHGLALPNRAILAVEAETRPYGSIRTSVVNGGRAVTLFEGLCSGVTGASVCKAAMGENVLPAVGLVATFFRNRRAILTSAGVAGYPCSYLHYHIGRVRYVAAGIDRPDGPGWVDRDAEATAFFRVWARLRHETLARLRHH